MIFEKLNQESFIDIKYGNIHYQLREKPENIEDKIPYDTLVEELQLFLKSLKNDNDGVSDGEIHEHKSMCDEDMSQYLDLDSCLAMTMDYQENYTLKDLQKIAEYYDISIRKLCKAELIEKITEFEDNKENEEKTFQRNKMWNYMKQIKKDKFLKSYLIFDSPILTK